MTNSRSFRPFGLFAAAIIVGSSLIIGCSTEVDPDEEYAQEGDETEEDLDNVDPGMSVDDEPSESISSELGGCRQCSNCVLYARCRQPRLPSGLTYWSQKKARINSQKGRAGCVAMINTGSAYGHVAYVTSVNNGRIRIAEGNWPRGRCGTRSGTKSSLRIAGFWCPR